MRRCVGLFLLFQLVLLVGCKDSGPGRFRVSGNAKFEGNPIPFGDVVFTPDGSKKNSGPQGIAQIRDGKYDTAASGGKGFGGGPTIIRVTGFSGEGGKVICEYQYKADLPRSETTHDIDVPKAGASSRPQKK